MDRHVDIWRWDVVLMLAAACGRQSLEAVAAPPSPSDCATLRLHGQRNEAQACYQSLTLSSDPYLRAEGDWGLELYQDANNEFRTAVAQADRNAQYRVRWGRLLHERFNDPEAANLFNEALQLDPKNAGAYLGLAVVSAAASTERRRITSPRRCSSIRSWSKPTS